MHVTAQYVIFLVLQRHLYNGQPLAKNFAPMSSIQSFNSETTKSSPNKSCIQSISLSKTSFSGKTAAVHTYSSHELKHNTTPPSITNSVYLLHCNVRSLYPKLDLLQSEILLFYPQVHVLQKLGWTMMFLIMRYFLMVLAL